MARRWTEKEKNKLEDKWGSMPVKQLAKSLKRSIQAVRSKAREMNLGPMGSVNALTGREISRILGVNNKTVRYWIKYNGLPAKKILLGVRREYYQITYDELLKWLKDNQKHWDSRKVELYALGSEPDWLKEKRKTDIYKKNPRPWTQHDDMLLIKYLNEGLSYAEIARRMKRERKLITNHLSKIKVTQKGYKVG